MCRSHADRPPLGGRGHAPVVEATVTDGEPSTGCTDGEPSTGCADEPGDRPDRNVSVTRILPLGAIGLVRTIGLVRPDRHDAPGDGRAERHDRIRYIAVRR